MIKKEVDSDLQGYSTLKKELDGQTSQTKPNPSSISQDKTSALSP